MYPEYDQERQYINGELRKTGVQELNFKTLMNLPDGSSSGVLFEFIRQTGLMGGILICGPHTRAEGGSNAINKLVANRCYKPKRRRFFQTEWFILSAEVFPI